MLKYSIHQDIFLFQHPLMDEDWLYFAKKKNTAEHYLD
jgi:hypothetical protein